VIVLNQSIPHEKPSLRATMMALDASLFDLINLTWSSPFLDHGMPVISSLDVWKPFVIVGVLAILIFGGQSGRLCLLSILVGLLLGDGIVSHALKHAVGRPRPRDVRDGALVRSLSPGEPKWLHVFEPPLVVVCHPQVDKVSHGNSFPSGHVVNLSMVAAVAFQFRRRAGMVLGLVGFLVAWSRIYCGAHWPSDIPPSILIGVVTGFVSVRFVRWIARRLARRVPPPTSLTEVLS
jgi:membrane-associated phospholipid phosphatase